MYKSAFIEYERILRRYGLYDMKNKQIAKRVNKELSELEKIMETIIYNLESDYLEKLPKKRYFEKDLWKQYNQRHLFFKSYYHKLKEKL